MHSHHSGDEHQQPDNPERGLRAASAAAAQSGRRTGITSGLCQRLPPSNSRSDSRPVTASSDVPPHRPALDAHAGTARLAPACAAGSRIREPATGTPGCRSAPSSWRPQAARAAVTASANAPTRSGSQLAAAHHGDQDQQRDDDQHDRRVFAGRGRAGHPTGQPHVAPRGRRVGLCRRSSHSFAA